MPTIINEETGLEFESIHLSDLAKIIDLYFGQLEKKYADRPKLTEEFGFPIDKLTQGNLIIGYSYFTIETSGEIIFKAIINPGDSSGDLENKMINYSRQKYLSKKELDHNGMRNSIHRIVDWLNWCG
ncbi:hypothetical protein [Chryseobacterium turcicum]|uniref:Uncharacterized protein n=1 Tax=Chryseobacterium turcicum TaxID=2898076 RepID=A0A9Q3V243_9FLAO|nr:hypothetical protein [Chryseobacterium turcicum]MCD1117429.1 hypothetical protein [Chryseobacterium turcicum]